MKQTLALVLALWLTVLLSAGCSPTPDKTDAFVKPENYTAVVKVTINPAVNLYLNDAYTVLAVEYLNADARSAYQEKEAEMVGHSLDDCAKTIVEQAVNGGYLTEDNRDIHIDVSEVKDSSRQDEVITQAENGFLIAVQPVTILPIRVYASSGQTTTNRSEDTTTLGDQTTTTVDGATATVTDVSPTTGDAITTLPNVTTKPNITTIPNVTTPIPTTKQPTVETTSVTTTQKPTTSIPTTTALPTLDPSLVKQSVEYKGTPKEVPGGLATPMLLFEGDICVVMVYDHVLEPEEEGAPPFEFNGKIYYGQGAGMSPLPFEVKDKIVHVLDNDEVILKVVLQADGALRIIESSYENFAAGDILTLTA